MLKQYMQYFTKRSKNFQYITASLVILILATLGTVLLTGSHASTPYVSTTTDHGTLANGAVSQTCTGSTDGNCVVFKGTGGTGGSVNCTQTLNPTSNLASAIVSAANGSTICLSSGSYPYFFVNGARHSSYVTIESASGATAILTNNPRIDDSSFLAFKNLSMSDGILVEDGSSGTSSNLQFIDNNVYGNAGIRFQEWTSTITNILIEGNYIHDVDAPGACSGSSAGTNGQGVTLQGADNVTIKNNTFKSIGWHYIQGGGGTVGVTVDHNLFTGPQPADDYSCAHLNVWQIFAGGNNDSFTNNVVVGSTATGTAPVTVISLIFENGPGGAVCSTTMTNTVVNNNLFVDQAGSFETEIGQTTNLTFTHNTIVGSAYGSQVADSSCGASTNVTQDNNIVTNNANGSYNFVFGGCTGTCNIDYNVSQDKSAGPSDGVHSGASWGDLPGTTHYVTSWTPNWQNTSWTPGNFAPGGNYSPPAGYYQPAGLPFQSGYQGSIGP